MRHFMLNEANIINHLKTEFPQYLGDDAAVIPASGDNCYVITKDLLIEDIHFRPHYVNAASLAHKALQVNLSDIAAMGANAHFALLGISIPVTHEKYAQDFLQTFCEVCKSSSITLIGGDTTRSPDKLFLSLTLIGLAEKNNLRFRTTALVNDLICVIGNLGHAHIGLKAFESSSQDLNLFKNAFLKPQAYTAEGIWLGRQPTVHAMMDISDGLFIDLSRLCAASEVGAEINLDSLSISNEFTAACLQLTIDPLTTMLTGGEDYGLLFTVAPDTYADFSNQFKESFGFELKCIGHIRDGKDVSFIQNKLPKQLALKSFSHFGE